MIREEDIVAVGKIFKPHSFKGELSVDLDFNLSEEDVKGLPVFVRIDGILVPFFPTGLRGGRMANSFIKFRNVDSDAQALKLANHTLYMLKSDLREIADMEGEDFERIIEGLDGYRVINLNNNETIGYVEDIEEGIEYDYIVVRKDSDGKTVEIPFIDEFIEEISSPEGDTEGIVKVNLPEGFLELN